LLKEDAFFISLKLLQQQVGVSAYFHVILCSETIHQELLILRIYLWHYKSRIPLDINTSRN
jgi:hypothetical protein